LLAFENGFLKISGVALSKRLILSILITVGIILVLLLQISFKDLYTLLSTLDPRWAALGSIALLLAILLRAFRFKWLIHSKAIPFSDLFRITAFYHLSIMVLPSKLGELSYPYLLNKNSGMNVTEGLASLVVSRVYDFVIVLMVLLSVSIGFQDLFKVNSTLVILLVTLLIGLIVFGLFYMSSFLRWFSNGLGKISNWAGSRSAKFVLWIQKKMDDMAEDFYAIKSRHTHFSVSLASLASWAMIFCAFYAYMKAFGVEIPFTKMIFGSTVGVIANALPVSGIGNWGTLEAGWAAGFIMVGLSKEKAIATGFGVHIIIFVTCAILSFFCWVTPKKQKNPSPISL
jgi:glycosyltransferase 2 family protein